MNAAGPSEVGAALAGAAVPGAVAPALDAGARTRRGVASWLTTTDHKDIGLLYISAAFAFFLVAVCFAMLMRTQLIRPNNTLLAPNQYNQIFTMHGTTMVFLFAMPLLAGFANYLVPLMIGARDMAFPRLNAFSFWMFLGGGLFLYSSFLFGGAPNTGWFSYAPLTETTFATSHGVDFWIFAILMLGVSSIVGAINFIVTMNRLRAPGMTMSRMPIFAYATYVNSYLIIVALPSLAAAVVLLYLDRHFGTAFYNPTRGGDPILWQHLFWFFGHPEVYILILPAFGMMSEVVPVFSRKPLFGRATMRVMILIIGFLGFAVWAHHMFATGASVWFDAIFAALSMVIAVPTGVKIFNWLGTMYGGSLRMETPLFFACGFIALFTIGGLTGVTMAAVPWDWQVEDTYYVVGHLHNVLFGGTLFGVFAGVYYWFPKITGRMLSDRLGKAHFWLLFVGFNLTFLSLYVLGLLGMPRRVYTYAGDLGWNGWNLLSTIGGYTIAAGIIVFLVNVYRSLRRGRAAGDDPWDAWTLEWATGSPPPWYNFADLPAIRSPRPLWDLKHPDRADYLPAGQRGAALVTATAGAAGAGVADASVVADTTADGPPGATAAGALSRGGARGPAPRDPAPGGAAAALSGPPHELPPTSTAPLLVAVAVLGLAVGGVGRSWVVAVLAEVFLLGAVVAWIWQPWKAPEPVAVAAVPAGAADAEMAGGAAGSAGAAPTDAAASADDSNAHQGMVYFVASESVYFLAIILGYVHLRLLQGTWPPPGMPKLGTSLPIVGALVLLTSGLTAHWGLQQLRAERQAWFRAAIIVTALLGLSFLGIQAYEYSHVGFGLRAGVMGSTFFTLTGFHGAHVVAGILVLILMLAASWGARLTPGRRGMAEAGVLYWHFVDAVWIVLILVLYLF